MKTALRLGWVAAFLFNGGVFGQGATGSFVSGTSADEDAIRAIVAAESADQQNAHVAADLDWENAFGVRYTNLKKRDAWFNANIAPGFNDATNQTIEVKIRFLEPSVAVADEYWHVAGQVYPGESKPGPDRWGRTTYIFKKEDGAWTEVMERVADLRAPYFKHYDTIPAAAAVPEATLAGLAGTYDTASKRKFTIAVDGNCLTLMSRGGTYKVVPTSESEFLSFRADDTAQYQKLVFKTSADGAVTVILSYADGEVMTTATKEK